MAVHSRISAEPLAWLYREVSGLSDAVARYRRYRHTRAEMERLTQRELDDLGFSRSALKDIAWEASKDI